MTTNYTTTYSVGKAVDMEILVNNNPISTYYFEGKTYVEGKKDSSFKIKLTNNHYRQIEAVLSIDGLSVINGKPADSNSVGYIIESGRSVVIDGWREDNNKVREFVFKDKENSYAGKSGEDTACCGIIELLVYEKKVETTITYTNWNLNRWWWKDWNDWFIKPYTNIWGQPKYTSENNMFYNTSLGTGSSALKSEEKCAYGDSVFDLGTGYGEKKDSPVNEVHFDRGNIIHTDSIYYASRKGLETVGIEFNAKPKINFPKKTLTKYCSFPEE